MRAAAGEARIPYGGEDLTVREWSERTGLPYGAIYNRYFKLRWSAKETLSTPLKKRGGRVPGRGPVETAKSLTADSDWTLALRAAIVLMALKDYEKPYYRADVELFFRDEFELLFDADGQRFLRSLAESA